LGYHQISAEEKDFLQQFFAVVILLPISDTVVQKAIALRQQRKMTLGDEVIAASALVYNKTLVSRNVKDFEWIDELKLPIPWGRWKTAFLQGYRTGLNVARHSCIR